MKLFLRRLPLTTPCLGENLMAEELGKYLFGRLPL